MNELTPEDEALIQAAKDTITQLYQYGKHHVGAALRTISGDIVTAVNVDGYVGRVGICAESVVLGKAISEGETGFLSIVAVYHPRPDDPNHKLRIVAPCGVCRELLSDYNPNAEVIYAEDSTTKKTKVSNLLPAKYTKM